MSHNYKFLQELNKSAGEFDRICQKVRAFDKICPSVGGSAGQIVRVLEPLTKFVNYQTKYHHLGLLESLPSSHLLTIHLPRGLVSL
jgi:hypothetical protein